MNNELRKHRYKEQNTAEKKEKSATSLFISNFYICIIKIGSNNVKVATITLILRLPIQIFKQNAVIMVSEGLVERMLYLVLHRKQYQKKKQTKRLNVERPEEYVGYEVDIKWHKADGTGGILYIISNSEKRNDP